MTENGCYVICDLRGAVDLCAADPAAVARTIVDRATTPGRKAIFLKNAEGASVKQRRTSDPESTVRFVVLRLHEAGLIKASPRKIIAQGTDWRFLNEVKKELKG